jgi:hypothetical protein
MTRWSAITGPRRSCSALAYGSRSTAAAEKTSTRSYTTSGDATAGGGGLAHATAPRPPAIAPGFHVVARKINLPPACASSAVRSRVVRVLQDFRAGRGESFARPFASDAVFQPYNGTAAAPSRTVPAARGIAGFVERRHAAGDVWMGTALIPPTSSNRVLAIYGLRLEVLVRGRTFERRGAKIVVRCDSGQIRAWVGPVIPRSAA